MSDFDVQKEMKEMFFNKLKTLSTTQLEEIIAKAIGNHLEVNYECKITTIEYTDFMQGKGAKITLEIKK